MEIIEDRHGKASIIVTSQLPVSLWHEAIGEKTIADAILDRIVHGAHRIELIGASLRKKWTKTTNELNKNFFCIMLIDTRNITIEMKSIGM